MIILDTCVIYGMKLDGTEAALLRAIQETGTDRVTVPWMVLEERAAQLALKYSAAHEKASVALRQLQRETPGDVPALGAPDPEAVRAHWRNKLTELVGVLPTSETALREGMYREANILPPASFMPHPTKPNKVLKRGARDAAIWMSAVEYARAHPQDTVYFVSNNTSDFRDGSGPYLPPMDKDVEGLGDRFIHLTRLTDLLKLIAPPVEVTPEQVEKLLPSYTDNIRDAAMVRWGNPILGLSTRFSVLRQLTGEVEEAQGWMASKKSLHIKAVKVTDVKGYRLGDREWCTATVQWQFIGVAILEKSLASGCCTWSTRIVMPLVEDGPSPRILSAELPEAPADDQGIEWPTNLPDPTVHTKELRHLLEMLKPSSKLETAAALLSYAMRDTWNAAESREARQRFIEQERHDKIALDVAADAAAELAAEEGWETGEDDLWHGLE
ncbi:PIN domain-containing protein (plasmid) [Streptomyces sp. NBC_00841]|uniref:PIN domain-containing protein n=1 Tax=Streptomyces sp. NBC_00841 TaxID=2975847 RepID=UPI002DD97B2B|nr:PIN domain-containing protein [Streptomyces sp. NBC_00841]WSA05990.1 PIN domain-containing protein [Streptomyces sp. NBC_00841]